MAGLGNGSCKKVVSSVAIITLLLEQQTLQQKIVGAFEIEKSYLIVRSIFLAICVSRPSCVG